ncbi:hypothetical protein JJQ72_18345 [Paenibacillus sp. F411]|uniref:Uncharacterized protein n=2 Tax=Paenibacillus TaxID=44249 RepID=A0A4P8XF41_9BACL|nr:hypothetical protein [Paenibacillus sp. F411]QCT00768.1 hypothetical protein E6C60_0040 [Paenibacillus algicola]
MLTHHSHFQYHMKHGIPVQVYDQGVHITLGCITAVEPQFVEIEGAVYNRNCFTFVSRPGY